MLNRYGINSYAARTGRLTSAAHLCSSPSLRVFQKSTGLKGEIGGEGLGLNPSVGNGCSVGYQTCFLGVSWPALHSAGMPTVCARQSWKTPMCTRGKLTQGGLTRSLPVTCVQV